MLVIVVTLQLDGTTDCFSSWAVCMVPSYIMKSRPQAGGFHLNSSLTPLTPIFKVCGIFSNRVLPSSTRSATKVSWYSLTNNSNGVCHAWHQGFISLWFFGGGIITPSSMMSFKNICMCVYIYIIHAFLSKNKMMFAHSFFKCLQCYLSLSSSSCPSAVKVSTLFFPFLP